MNHRERILAALNHEEPDRIPVDLGGTLATSINIQAYQKLHKMHGIAGEPKVFSRRSMIADVDDEILQRYSIDTRSLPLLGNSRPTESYPNGGYKDEWGVVREQPEPLGHYMDTVNPLDGNCTLQDIEDYAWPDPHDPGYTLGLAEAGAQLRAKSDAALIMSLPVGPLHLAQWMRGYENWMMDLAGNLEIYTAMMDKITDLWLKISKGMLDAAQANCDVVLYGDDVAFQTGPMVSRQTYEKHIKPYQRRVMGLLKQYPTKILYHSCGSVVNLIEDFIELGFDALNPVQVSAKDMDPERLKRDYGDRISFWGGVDTQRVLCRGSVADVRKEVRERLRVFAPGGGYILCAVHNIQGEVPAENIDAMYDEALLSGTYPIRSK